MIEEFVIIMLSALLVVGVMTCAMVCSVIAFLLYNLYKDSKKQ